MADGRLVVDGRLRRATERYGARLLLFGAAALVVAVPFAVLVEQIVQRGPVDAFDHRIATAVHRLACGRSGVESTARVVTFLGSVPFLAVVVVVTTAFLLRRRLWWLALFMAATAVVGSLLDSAVKIAVGRARPSLVGCRIYASGKSFPSGHSMSSLVVYGSIALIVLPALPAGRRRVLLWATAVLVGSIGLSRVVLGAHFPTDVLGSWLLGGAWLATSVALFEVYRRDRGRRPSAVVKTGLEPEIGPVLRAGTPPAKDPE